VTPGRESLPQLAVPVARRVFGRSLTLQASYNDQRMQNLGLLAALAPWLRGQGLDREQLRRICRRYYGYFNTNPYLANFVVGGLLRLEHDRLGGGAVPDRLVVGFRDTLARACGSLGDQLFWLGLRPALMMLAALLALVGRWETILALLLAFTVAQLRLRRRALDLGFGLGCDVVDVLSRPEWHRAIAWVGRAALFLTGLAAGFYFAGVLSLAPTIRAGLLAAVAAVGLGLPSLLRTRVSGEVQLLVALVVAGLLEAVF
jgi:mannose/fructose/N-acetylgalactosamine-specific phosphotransferase system component IID